MCCRASFSNIRKVAGQKSSVVVFVRTNPNIDDRSLFMLRCIPPRNGKLARELKIIWEISMLCCRWICLAFDNCTTASNHGCPAYSVIRRKLILTLRSIQYAALRRWQTHSRCLRHSSEDDLLRTCTLIPACFR